MPQVVDFQKSSDPRDVIHHAVQMLSQGELVALPTETVYILAAHSLQTKAVKKLQQLVHESENEGCPLLISGESAALDYVPDMPQLARKLARRCWPGPVTIGLEVSCTHGLLSQLPEISHNAVVFDGQIRLRVPAHEAVQAILKLLPAPLVTLNDSDVSGRQPVHTADEVQEYFGDAVSLIVDDGACRYGEPSTVVSISGDQWKLVHTGVVSEVMLGRLSSEVYLFVCTGNTCRSPMAEVLFRKMLAERLQCSEDELFDRGYVVGSAGLAAVSGAPSSPDAVDVLAKRGIDLRSHASQPLTDRLLDQADHIFTMTRGHGDSILAVRPDLADRVELLARNGSDISDPIGGGPDEYEICEQEIERHIRTIVEQIQVS